VGSDKAEPHLDIKLVH